MIWLFCWNVHYPRPVILLEWHIYGWILANQNRYIYGHVIDFFTVIMSLVLLMGFILSWMFTPSFESSRKMETACFMTAVNDVVPFEWMPLNKNIFLVMWILFRLVCSFFENFVNFSFDFLK